MSRPQKPTKPAGKYSALDALYARLPKIFCKRKCQDSCGPIMMSRLEQERITEASGLRAQNPMLQLTRAALLGQDKALSCQHLCGGSCNVYDARPLICRLWGLVKEMACPWGCTPERWLTDAEARSFLDQARRLGV